MLFRSLAARDLVDDLTLMTGPKAAGAGKPAIGPALAGWIDQTRASGLIDSATWGEDRVETFVRNR